MDQASVSERDTHHEVGRTQPSRAHVDQTQHKSRQGKRGQTERRRIGDVSALDLLVETRLELSSKGRQTLSVAAGVDVSQRAIAEAGGSFGCLVLLRAHLAIYASAIGFFVVITRAVARVLGIGVS